MATADRLFYGEGIRAVGVDKIAATARKFGVSTPAVTHHSVATGVSTAQCQNPGFRGTDAASEMRPVVSDPGLRAR